jgi:hypothetical protein
MLATTPPASASAIIFGGETIDHDLFHLSVAWA